MPKASRNTASETVTVDGFDGRYQRFEGAYTVASRATRPTRTLRSSFEACPTTAASAPTGATLRAAILFRYADREETYEAGEAYYAPPGHTPVCFAGTELIEFSPTDAHDETTAVLVENMRAAGLVG